jgi:hypothetical protein
VRLGEINDVRDIDEINVYSLGRGSDYDGRDTSPMMNRHDPKVEPITGGVYEVTAVDAELTSTKLNEYKALLVGAPCPPLY